jgi:deoxyribonuclease V
MNIVHDHPWNIPPKEARELQKKIAENVIVVPLKKTVSTVAGIDVGVREGKATAAVVVLSYPGLEPIISTTATRPVAFPYVPGLLTFREAPAILDALKKLETLPDVMIFDGQGRAHPLRLGIASHIGVLLDAPTIGCAKSRLCGEHDEPDQKRGSRAMLMDKGEIIGAVVRTRTGVKPVYVSPGHRVDLSTSVQLVLDCCPKYRLPETTRQAHRLAAAKKI